MDIRRRKRRNRLQYTLYRMAQRFALVMRRMGKSFSALRPAGRVFVFGIGAVIIGGFALLIVKPGKSKQTITPPQGSVAPVGTGYTTDPNALAQLLAAAAAAGSAWLGPAAAIADPAEAGLRAAAAQYAPGMSPDGQVAKGSLAEGGHVGFVANMDPSRCYTIVAYGAGVTDLDVILLAPPFYNLVAGQDGMAGPTAVIGAAPKPMCPLVPIAVPYKIDLYAKKGGGQVAAQLYSKPK